MIGMTGRSKHPPKSEARPLGTPRPKVPKTNRAGMEKVLDMLPTVEVSCTQPPIPAACVARSKHMTLTYKALSKNGKNAFYTGAATVLRFPLSAFANKRPPSSIEVEGDFAEAKVKLTAEERKAARENKPKPTLAEKIAKREAQLAKLKAQAHDDSL